MLAVCVCVAFEACWLSALQAMIRHLKDLLDQLKENNIGSHTGRHNVLDGSRQLTVSALMRQLSRNNRRHLKGADIRERQALQHLRHFLVTAADKSLPVHVASRNFRRSK